MSSRTDAKSILRGVDLYFMGGSLAQGHLGWRRRGWDRATAQISSPVQRTVSSSPKTRGQLMQALTGKKQESSNTARYFHLYKEGSSKEIILLGSGDLNS